MGRDDRKMKKNPFMYVWILFYFNKFSFFSRSLLILIKRTSIHKKGKKNRKIKSISKCQKKSKSKADEKKLKKDDLL